MISPAPTSVAAFVDGFCAGPVGRPLHLLSVADVDRRLGSADPASEASYGIRQFFLNGGSEAWAVRVAAASGSPPDADALLGDADTGTGLHALEGIEFNLLCVPGASRATGEGDSQAVLAAAVSMCERRSAVLLVDPPPDVRGADAIADWLRAGTVFGKPNAALYYPRARLGDAPAALAPSGTIAGLIARIDSSAGVWHSPAGTDAALNGVAELDDRVDQTEADALNRLGINALRSFPGVGIVSWGARTLASPESDVPEWRYLPVRRTALMLEQSIERGTGWAAVEPNDEQLWARLRESVGSFMFALHQRGAFAGATPRDKYFVRCDEETTTARDVEEGVVNILVGFAPLRPAEFVILRISRRAGRAER